MEQDNHHTQTPRFLVLKQSHQSSRQWSIDQFSNKTKQHSALPNPTKSSAQECLPYKEHQGRQEQQLVETNDKKDATDADEQDTKRKTAHDINAYDAHDIDQDTSRMNVQPTVKGREKTQSR